MIAGITALWEERAWERGAAIPSSWSCWGRAAKVSARLELLGAIVLWWKCCIWRNVDSWVSTLAFYFTRPGMNSLVHAYYVPSSGAEYWKFRFHSWLWYPENVPTKKKRTIMWLRSHDLWPVYYHTDLFKQQPGFSEIVQNMIEQSFAENTDSQCCTCYWGPASAYYRLYPSIMRLSLFGPNN